jgi:hypothetical protein
LPLEADVVLFQPGATLPLVEDPKSVVNGVVGSVTLGNGTNVSLDRLRVGIVPLPLDVVLFQPEAVLLLDRTSEPMSAEVVGRDKVGKGASVPLGILTVGMETLPADGETVTFQTGPALKLDEIPKSVVLGVVGNGALGKGRPVPVIPMLVTVKLEFQPVDIGPVGRVLLPEGFDVVFPGIDHGSEPLVDTDSVIPGPRVSVSEG